MSRYFITSTGTGIGKTLVTSSLCWQLKNVTAIKPVISGYDASDLSNDSAQILLSCGIEPTAAAQATISPWRFAAPLAPNMAAQREGKTLDFDALIAFCKESDATFIEGVGGVMVPLNDRTTVLDWMQALGFPVILTTGSYLGSISHTLTAIEALKNRNITLHAVIICESEHSSVLLDETAQTLETFITASIPVVKIPRFATTESPWKITPTLSWLCQKPPKC
jgi:dethiobiotin synthetase